MFRQVLCIEKVVRLIFSECISKEQEIYQFLLTCVNPLSPIQAQAFMDYGFEPDSMFSFVHEGNLCALLQTYRRTLMFLNQKTSVVFIARGFYKKGFKSRLDALIEAAVEAAGKTSLFILAETREPSLYRRLGFGKVSTRLESELIEVFSGADETNAVHLWDGLSDLYPLYRQFMSFFDGSVILSEAEFDNLLEEQTDAGSKIYCSLENGETAAFAITSAHPEGISLDTLIYADPGALLNLLAYFDSLYDVVHLHYSKAENLDALADLEIFPHSSLMMKVCDLGAFNRWQNAHAESFEDVFALLQRPQWNFLY